MPYIEKSQRPLLDEGIDDLVTRIDAIDPENPGILNYVITRILASSLDLHKPRYSKINKAVGVLECVKLELYRRVAAAYEDQKALDNGDVY